ncbi:MAG: DUF4910 domain-containing protein [Bacteroidales bacterium]|jgi:aminopeptidase YwaD|nr:DUF4910 domain-containing protein [Bacteroidales bacterium]
MKNWLFLICLLGLIPVSFAQDFDYSHEIIQELCDTSYHGRGYYEQGDFKAAQYISGEYEKHGLKTWHTSYFQHFNFPVGVFHGDMDVLIDNESLKPGHDFVLRSFSNGAKGNYEIYEIDTTTYDETTCLAELAALDSLSDAIVCNFNFARKHKVLYKAIYQSPAQILIFKWDDPLKFYKAHAAKQFHKCIIWAKSKNVPEHCKSLDIDIGKQFIESHITQNVIGYLEADNPNAEWLLFIAHYDHLGMLGESTFFSGANDNASGISMLLTVAEAYSAKSRKYNMAFVAVAGEECGLLGSKHYVENPSFPLEDIKLVINLDMVADNGDSLYVQHSEAAQLAIDKMEAYAKKKTLYKGFQYADLSPHSDHFPFAEKAIPAVSFSTHGDYNAHYHTPLDDMEHITMTGFKKLYKLIQGYINT